MWIVHVKRAISLLKINNGPKGSENPAACLKLIQLVQYNYHTISIDSFFVIWNYETSHIIPAIVKDSFKNLNSFKLIFFWLFVTFVDMITKYYLRLSSFCVFVLCAVVKARTEIFLILMSIDMQSHLANK